MNNVKLEPNYIICPMDSEMGTILSMIDQCSTPELRKELLEQIIEKYEAAKELSMERVYPRNVLMEMLIRYNTNKSGVVRILEERNLYCQLITDAANEIINDIEQEKVCKTKQCLHIFNFIAMFMENCKTFEEFEFIIDKVFPLYLVVLRSLLGQFAHCDHATESDLLHILNLVLKLILNTISKTWSKNRLKFSPDFIQLAYQYLQHKKIGFDVKIKCGILMGQSLNFLPDDEKTFITNKDYPVLDLIDLLNTDKPLKLKSFVIENIYHSDAMRIILFSTIIFSITRKHMKEYEIDGRPLTVFLYTALIDCGKRTTGNSSEILEVCRQLEVLVHLFEKVPAEMFEEVFKGGLDFIWAHLDHFIDTVSHKTRTFYNKLVQMAAVRYTQGEINSVNLLVHYVKIMSPFNNVRLFSLDALIAGIGVEFVLNNFENLQKSLIVTMDDGSILSESIKTYTFLMQKSYQQMKDNEFIDVWLKPVLEILRKSDGNLFKSCQKLITVGFQMKPTIFYTLFPKEQIGSKKEWEVLLKCIQMIRVMGLQINAEPGDNPDLYWRNLVQKKKLELFMISQNEEVRLLALEVVVNCQKSTELVTDWEIVYLISYYSYNISTQIPASRNRMVALYKRLFTRVEAGYKVLLREITNQENYKKTHGLDENTENLLEKYKQKKKFYRAFILQFIALLINDLSPDANYPRRTSALELLTKLQELATTNEWKISFSPDDIDNLKIILHDSYESNKILAVNLLKTLPPSLLGLKSDEQTSMYFDHCFNLACNLRTSKCLSAAYMFKLCLYSDYSFQAGIQKKVQSGNRTFDMLLILTGKLRSLFNWTKNDVYNAAQNGPLHGLLLSIKTLILDCPILNKEREIFSKLFHELVLLCLAIKQVILPIVSSASPEGFLPETDTIYDVCESSSKAQMILFYAWRAMKEMTLLLAEIVRKTAEGPTTIFLEDEQMNNIGHFFVDIFIQSKHRGVFEQAFVGFSVICEKFWNSPIEKINILPRRWLENAMNLCIGKEVDTKLCPTRRSAGLPFLMLAIIAEEPTNRKVCFKKMMDRLLLTAAQSDESEEIRIHCMNVLRAIFRHAKMVNQTISFLGNGVICALIGFKSNSFGIRNSATLLYSILITKMFGVLRTQENDQIPLKNKLTFSNFALRYPKLFSFLLSTLSEECDKNNSIILHPVLYVLTRLYPSHISRTNQDLEKYLPHIDRCKSNPCYFIRDLAARASIPLISSELLAAHLLKIFEQIADSNIKDTKCYGLLLQVHHVLKMGSFSRPLDISSCISNCIHLFESVGERYSHMTVTLCMDVLTLLLIKFPAFDNLEILKKVVLVISKQLHDDGLILTCRGTYKWSRLKLLFYIVINKFEHVDITYDALFHQVVHYLCGTDFEAKKYCLHFLIYLNRTYNDFQYSEQPLLTSGEVEIPETVRELVDSFDVRSQKELLTFSHPYLVYFLCKELKFQKKCTSEYFILVFLLLMYYPCIIVTMFGKQESLDVLLRFCDCDNEELTSAILSCVGTLFLKLPIEALQRLKNRKLINILMKSASPAASDFRRLTVCNFLINIRHLVYRNDGLFKAHEVYDLLNIAMVLLEDEELEIRNTMSTFTVLDNCVKTDDRNQHIFEMVPDKARADLMSASMTLLPVDMAICFLFSWSCRHFAEVSSDVSSVFERGEPNLFSENVPIIYSASKVLNRHLWSLSDGLSYEDRTIYFEEQALIATTILVNALNKNPSPMMSQKTKVTVICSLRSIVTYLERAQIGDKEFARKFTDFFHQTILKYLANCCGPDFPSVKSIFTKIYGCILKSSSTICYGS